MARRAEVGVGRQYMVGAKCSNRSQPLETSIVSPPGAPVPASTSASPVRAFRAALAESRSAALVSLVLLVVGVALRLRLYLDARPLWLDEIWAALNIQGRSFAGLARPLDYDQSAPVGFLWVERLALLIGGVNELALRAFPLLAGCLFLVVLWMLARRLLDVRGAALCLAFAALSPTLIYFSNEVKPYGPDSLATAALIWLALDVLDAPESRHAWRRLAAGGVIALLFSTPSVFVLAAVGVALVAHPAIGRTRPGWRRLVATGSLWLGMFALGYLTVYRPAATSDFMQGFFDGVFLSLPPRELARGAIDAARRMWIDAFLGENDAMLPPKSLVLASLVSVGGAIALLRRRSASVALLLTVPFVVTAAASMAHRWPLVARLLVFLVPALIILLGAGLWTVAGALPARMRGAALVLVGGLVVLPALLFDLQRARLPLRRDDVASLVRDFLAARHPPSVMYVMGHGAPAWLYYSELWRQRDGDAFRVAAQRAAPSGDFPSRACTRQAPGLRVVFGAMPKTYLTDSALAGEAAWLAVQPERDVWLLTLKYERKAGLALEREILAHGGAKLEERSRNDVSLRHFRFAAAAPKDDPARHDIQCAATGTECRAARARAAGSPRAASADCRSSAS